MQISYDHLCKLFNNSYKPSIDDFWRTEGPNLSARILAKDHPKYLAALDDDIETFCNNLPLDGQTTEVKAYIKHYWLNRASIANLKG